MSGKKNPVMQSAFLRNDRVIPIEPHLHVGNNPRSIALLAEWLTTDRLLVPRFQRDYIWRRKKLIEWVETVIANTAVGVIVTYQINGEGPFFLADGFQRLTSTVKFMKNPMAFGFPFGTAQASNYCQAFFIPVQHRHYETHEFAMVAFQNLNKGTQATPAEYHKGELCLEESGLGEELYKKIVKSVEIVEAMKLSGKGRGRNAESKALRDCLGLFYQYTTNASIVTFYNVGKIQNDKVSIESRLRNLMENERWSAEDIKQKIKNFQTFLAGQIALFESICRETEQEGKAFSLTVVRWLFHLAIWRRNTGRSVETYHEFLRRLFNFFKKYATFTSRIEVDVLDSNFREVITLGLDKLGNLKALSRLFEVPLWEEKKNRRKQSNAALGYHRSHIDPFSQHGEGETILEPAPLNLSRGAKSIEDDLVMNQEAFLQII